MCVLYRFLSLSRSLCSCRFYSLSFYEYRCVKWLGMAHSFVVEPLRFIWFCCCFRVFFFVVSLFLLIKHHKFLIELGNTIHTGASKHDSIFIFIGFALFLSVSEISFEWFWFYLIRLNFFLCDQTDEIKAFRLLCAWIWWHTCEAMECNWDGAIWSSSKDFAGSFPNEPFRT